MNCQTLQKVKSEQENLSKQFVQNIKNFERRNFKTDPMMLLMANNGTPNLSAPLPQTIPSNIPQNIPPINGQFPNPLNQQNGLLSLQNMGSLQNQNHLNRLSSNQLNARQATTVSIAQGLNRFPRGEWEEDRNRYYPYRYPNEYYSSYNRFYYPKYPNYQGNFRNGYQNWENKSPYYKSNTVQGNNQPWNNGGGGGSNTYYGPEKDNWRGRFGNWKGRFWKANGRYDEEYRSEYDKKVPYSPHYFRNEWEYEEKQYRSSKREIKLEGQFETWDGKWENYDKGKGRYPKNEEKGFHKGDGKGGEEEEGKGSSPEGKENTKEVVEKEELNDWGVLDTSPKENSENTSPYYPEKQDSWYILSLRRPCVGV